MALMTFPVALTDFWLRLPIAEMQIELPELMQASRTRSGEIVAADLGARIWRGKVTLGRMTRAEAADAQTLISALRVAGRTFLACDVTRPGPRLDPAGVTLGAATVTIHALHANARQLRLAGLPVGYTLRRGDRLAFDYGAPARRALHEVVDDSVVAAGDGRTDQVEVVPYIRPGAATGATVTLLRPALRAMLVPGATVIGTTRRTITEGTMFEFQQTLGAA